MRFVDKLVNLLTGLGTAKDKNTGTQYGIPVIPVDQLANAYRGDWLPRKVVDIPAQDATREWRNWVADEKQIKAIEALETALGLQGKVEEALIKARLIGGAAIYMGVDGTGEPHEELVLAKVRKDALKYLYVVEMHELSAGPLVRDITSKYFGQPESFQFSPSGAAVLTIHPSRVVLFVPAPTPLRSLQSSCWGDSVLLSKSDALRNASLAMESVANLMHESTLDIYKVPDLLNNVGDQEWRSLLIQRFQLAQLSKSSINALLLDKNEEHDRKETTFTGIPDTIAQLLNAAAGAADIPLTRLIGSSPGGLNATGESDLRNYYDAVGAWQKVKLTPILAPLDAVLIASALGSEGTGVHYEWRPLWQLKPTEKATNLSTKATAISALYNTGLVPDEVLAPAVINMLIEDGQLPGIESAHAEYDAQLDENDPQVSGQFAAGKGKAPAVGGEDKPQDQALNGAQITAVQGIVTAVAAKELPAETAKLLIVAAFPFLSEQAVQAMLTPLEGFEPAKPAPVPAPLAGQPPDKATPQPQDPPRPAPMGDGKDKPLYVSRKVVNAAEIAAWAKEQGLEVDESQLHVTIIYSRAAVNWMAMGEAWGSELKVAAGGPRDMALYGPEGDTLVLEFSCGELAWRHDALKSRGCSWDWPAYQPHISIAKVSGIDPEQLTPYAGEIILGPEIFEEALSGEERAARAARQHDSMPRGAQQAIIDAIKALPAPVINVDARTTVHPAGPQVVVQPADVNVEVKPAAITVEPAPVHVQQAGVQQVQIVGMPARETSTEIVRDESGEIASSRQVEKDA